MGIMEWDDKLDLNIEEINNQHKQLIDSDK